MGLYRFPLGNLSYFTGTTERVLHFYLLWGQTPD